MNPESMARWTGHDRDISFEPEDFEILDLTLDLIPELRICALTVKRARAADVSYPIRGTETIIRLLEGERFEGAGHRIQPDDVRTYMLSEFFPIEHEGELISRVYLALTRCNHELAMAARIQPATLAKLDTLGLQFPRG